jgi:hypothetical protein
MRTEINVLTGKVTEHEDAPVTWEVPTQVEQTKPTVEQLQAQLATIAAQLQELQGTV